jgi:hypothetical protein
VFFWVRASRQSLPVPMYSQSDFNVWSVLKNCIGKELSKITMPVIFNEPLSFLQRMVEYMEYSALLNTAAQQTDPVDRMKVSYTSVNTNNGQTRHQFPPISDLFLLISGR